ncbi:MAG: TlpA family protein disulfide reductase [Rhodothermaceae bacterium]
MIWKLKTIAILLISIAFAQSDYKSNSDGYKNYHAHNFTLPDLEGRKVSLSDYKDQIIVLDFWATWCTPCIASFPAMKEAQNYFKNKNIDVKFLFIDTWEDLEQDVLINDIKTILKKNNYQFHVLLDLNSEVVEKYQIEGLPTKIIIGRDGNVKYMSTGSSGDPNEVVAELKEIISKINKSE